MNTISKKIQEMGVVPVVVLNDAKDAKPLAQALCEGGLPCAEVTFRTEAAEESIRLMTECYPDMFVGAGTVLTTEQVDRAVNAGAKFIVSPGFDPEIVDYCLEKNIPIYPGCITPSEVAQAVKRGLEVVKFFPAEQFGGVSTIKALAAPYVGVKFMPTGGVNAKNLDSYLSCDKIVACGGSWMVKGDVQQCYTAKERRLLQHTCAQLHAGETLTLQKLVWIDWRDDRQAALDEWGSASLRQLEMCAQQSYDQLLAASTENWRQWWQKRRITVNGGDAHDQQALDYALYHLRIMTPAHDERSSIAAKGLTGEGYKGHVFWDTEVFLLPFHLFSDPTVARSLLRYRWHNLPGAQEKARRNGWQGALFPWESARSGEEETPEFAAINIRTGLRQKVASAQAEHHLVADIAWAVIQYWRTTGDESFIAHEGMALLLETAKFWISRAVRVNDRLEIHDVIGPDEYTEHVNNNAFTSYMAYYNVQQALNIARQFGCSDDAFIHRAEMYLKELRLPEIQPDGVLPQDDLFMAKPVINLAKYKAAAGKQTILLDYSRAEVNEMQILKQADVVMLNYMLPEQFSAASCLANLQFYEPRTIHDSSLSKAIHGIVAARCGLLTQSYQFWREGTEIDLGADPHSCDDGIHAAATGAIWLGAIQGFAGVSVRDGELHLNPALPEQWQQLSFPLFWQGCELQVTLDAQRIAIRTSAPVSLRLNGQLIYVAEESVFCLGDFILPFNGTATTHLEGE